jgi:putative endonuclease
VFSLFRKTKPLGEQGEDLAAKYLKKAGYKILDCNVQLGRYEIDLIVSQGDTTIFVEVKTRRTDDPVSPEENVDQKKQHHIIQAAKLYMSKEDDPERYYRFDIVAVVLPEKGPAEIQHFTDAFQIK